MSILFTFEEESQPRKDGRQSRIWKPPQPLLEIDFVYGDHLRNIYHTWPEQAGISLFEGYVSRSRGAVHVGRDQTDNGRCYAAAIKNITLYDNAGVPFGGGRTRGWPEVKPIDVTLADLSNGRNFHHRLVRGSFFLNFQTKCFSSGPDSFAYAWFNRSKIIACFRFRRYSRSASEISPLRLSPRSRAASSACFMSESSTDIAVFILSVIPYDTPSGSEPMHHF